MAGGGSGQIPASRRPWPAGHGRRATRRSPRPDSWSRLGQRVLRRIRPAERGGDHRGRQRSGKIVSPAGQYMGREAGVEVHSGGCALKLAGGGSRPGVPMEAAMAARWMARRTRGGAASRLYRRRVGEGSHGFVAKGPPTLMRAYDVLASAGAPVAGRHRADRRADGSVVRATSESATRGRGCPEGAAHGPGVTGPPRRPSTSARRRRHVAALWSVGRGGERDVARSGLTCCGAGYFDHVLLPKFELKCTEE
jgi:hypothetical protein